MQGKEQTNCSYTITDTQIKKHVIVKKNQPLHILAYLG